MTSVTQHEGVHPVEDPIAAELRRTACLSGLPEPRFFATFTPRRRREMSYHLDASAPGIRIRVNVRGSGAMTATIAMPCVLIEQGRILRLDEPHSLAWVETGKEAVLQSSLGHLHLETYPDPVAVLDAFLDALRPRRTAVGAGGYRQWRLAVQLLTDRIARETGRPVEVVATPPIPPEKGHDGQTRKGRTAIRIYDISDCDVPLPIEGYAAEFDEIEDSMAPEAVGLTLLPPGYIARHPCREIFHAR